MPPVAGSLVPANLAKKFCGESDVPLTSGSHAVPSYSLKRTIQSGVQLPSNSNDARNSPNCDQSDSFLTFSTRTPPLASAGPLGARHTRHPLHSLPLLTNNCPSAAKEKRSWLPRDPPPRQYILFFRLLFLGFRSQNLSMREPS